MPKALVVLKTWYFAFLLLGCGGDRVPTITEIEMIPSTAIRGVSTAIKVSFNYQNGDDDLKEVRLSITEPDDDLLSPTPIEISGFQGSQGVVEVSLDLTFSKVGEHGFEFLLQDEAGNNSNSLNTSLVVSE